jgi:hypothetical protein
MSEEIGLMDSSIRQDVLEAMQANKPPFAAYKKTILGQVAIKYLDPIRMRVEETVLKGDPNKPEDEENCIFKVWSVAEDVYFKRHNRFHLNKGELVPWEFKELEAPTVNQISDEEIELILQKPFFALKNKLQEFDSPIPVRRFLLMAEKMNRPVNTCNYIKQRLEELETEK